MKRIVMAVFAVVFFASGSVGAKDVTYASPDKKKKAVYSCKYAFQKQTCPNTGVVSYRTDCDISIYNKGKRYSFASGVFWDQKKEWAKSHSLERGKPAWSPDSRYFAYMKVGTHLNSELAAVIDTSNNEYRLLYAPNKDEEFCANDKDGTYSGDAPKIFLKKNSFGICVINFSDIYSEGDMNYTRVYFIEYSFSGKQISKKTLKLIFEEDGV